MGSGAALCARAIRFRPAERARAAGLLLFIGAGVALSLAIALGRGSYAARMPDRYALFSAIPLMAALIAWQLYAGPRVARRALCAIAIVLALMLPLNVHVGLKWRDWYVAGMERVERDIAAGMPIPTLAETHRKFLMHWSEDRLLQGMRHLHNAEIGPIGAASPHSLRE